MVHRVRSAAAMHHVVRLMDDATAAAAKDDLVYCLNVVSHTKDEPVSRMRGWCRKCAADGVDRCALSDFGTGVIRGERARRSLMARVMASCARHRLLN